MNPPHVNCSQLPNGPLSDHWQHEHGPGDLYNWYIFPRQDAQAKLEARRLGMRVVDMSPLYYRQDGHADEGDCLHYCLPGPTDLFSVLLLNMMYKNDI
ncbi:hypothetical protein B484DRAFT_409570 [Ochromonadaceae sp. CCMP2298]|nr:hypothetical protein B484DRAFT_409570 [Ochromonadaceae sp. CCMP2298]